MSTIEHFRWKSDFNSIGTGQQGGVRLRLPAVHLPRTWVRVPHSELRALLAALRTEVRGPLAAENSSPAADRVYGSDPGRRELPRLGRARSCGQGKVVFVPFSVILLLDRIH